MPDVQPLTNGDPRRLGAYEVAGRLGEGGQGVVYLGRGDAGQVAIKVLHAQLIEDAAARTRFLREVEVTKRVARFCTAQVLETGVAGDRPYIVSEYVPGPSLQQQVKREGPRHGAALDRLAVNTATALAAIHGAGVVHRDFKPGNVLMGPDGPVVIDFGIARALDTGGSMTAAASQVIGTPAFMAPEQLAEGRVGPAADVFAWGITMVFAATGAPAFGGRSIPNIINRILNDEPDIGALDGRLRDTVAASLAKDPARRPTARRLMDDLMGQGGTALAAPGAVTGPPGRVPGPPGAATELLGSGRGGGEPGAGPNAGTAAVPTPGHGTAGGATERIPPAAARHGGPAGVPPGGATERMPSPGARPGGATRILPGGGTERIPSAGPPDPGTHRPPPYAQAGPATRRLPSYGDPAAPGGPYPGPGIPPAGRPPVPYAAGPAPARRGANGVVAVLVVLGVLVVGIGVVWAATRSGNGSAAVAGPTTTPKRHHPAKRRHTPTHRGSARSTPARTPAARKTAPVAKANPYTPEKLCGNGFRVVDRHPVGTATVYLLYNDGAGTNCVVTMVARSTGRAYMGASLRVQGGGQDDRAGLSPFYAGPVRLPAKAQCVQWGGAYRTARWTSGWTHCAA